MSYGDQSIMDVNMEQYEREQADKDRQETQRSNEADFAKQEIARLRMLFGKIVYAVDVDMRDDALMNLADILAKKLRNEYGVFYTGEDITKGICS